MSNHRQGQLLDNVTCFNNSADATILETHNYKHLHLYGHTSTNHSLVLIGANDKNAVDWVKIATIFASDYHYNNGVFNTTSWDLLADLDHPPPYVKVGNISGSNAENVSIGYKLSN